MVSLAEEVDKLRSSGCAPNCRLSKAATELTKYSVMIQNHNQTNKAAGQASTDEIENLATHEHPSNDGDPFADELFDDEKQPRDMLNFMDRVDSDSLEQADLTSNHQEPISSTDLPMSSQYVLPEISLKNGVSVIPDDVKSDAATLSYLATVHSIFDAVFFSKEEQINLGNYEEYKSYLKNIMVSYFRPWKAFQFRATQIRRQALGVIGFRPHNLE